MITGIEFGSQPQGLSRHHNRGLIISRGLFIIAKIRYQDIAASSQCYFTPDQHQSLLFEIHSA